MKVSSNFMSNRIETDSFNGKYFKQFIISSLI
jgi:hypothetical protein